MCVTQFVCRHACVRAPLSVCVFSIMCEHSCALFCFSPWLGDLENLLQKGQRDAEDSPEEADGSISSRKNR